VYKIFFSSEKKSLHVYTLLPNNIVILESRKGMQGRNQIFIKSGAVAYINEYYPFGLVNQQTSSTQYGSKEQRYKFGSKELMKDFNLEQQDFGARLYNPQIGRFIRVDPMADHRINYTPYNYVRNNPMRLIDPNGMLDANPNDYVFNQNGNFVRIDKNNTPDRLFIENSNAGTKTGYAFNDPENDTRAIRNSISSKGEEGINKVEVMSDDKVNGMIDASGVKNVTGDPVAFAASQGTGKMDFGINGLRTGEFDASSFYIRGGIAYNVGDIGNYMWGLGMANLGIEYMTAVMGAQFNNMVNGRRQKTVNYSFGPGTNGAPSLFDSPGDQRAIKAGYFSDKKVNANRKMNAQIRYEEQMDMLHSGELPNGDD
jgi:RHS repeat-associated protein